MSKPEFVINDEVLARLDLAPDSPTEIVRILGLTETDIDVMLASPLPLTDKDRQDLLSLREAVVQLREQTSRSIERDSPRLDVFVTQKPALAEGYITRSLSFAGSTYSWTFYEGFVGRIWYHPPGDAEPVLVYRQEGTYHVPGGKDPDTQTTVTITGGPLNLDIKLDVDDGPVNPVTKRGPVESFTVDFKRKSTPVPSHPKRVKPVKGADQIERITVRERVTVRGGVFASQGGGGGTTVENNASTCPPFCR